MVAVDKPAPRAGVRVIVSACVGLAVALSGCAADARRAGDDAATSSAEAVTRYVRSDVVRPGVPPTSQFQRVRSWLIAALGPVTATSPDLTGLGSPEWRMLTATGSRVEIAVYEYGRTTAIEGANSAWGHVCRRYSVDRASRLVASDVECPAGLPERPD